MGKIPWRFQRSKKARNLVILLCHPGDVSYSYELLVKMHHLSERRATIAVVFDEDLYFCLTERYQKNTNTSKEESSSVGAVRAL
jgi:hypothetical protein